MTPHEVLSKRSRAYKELGLAERDVSEDELLDLMIEEPTLLKRPLVITAQGSSVGFNRERLTELTSGDAR